jgi:acetyltransferase-like isoleucine patch superfamily enzyme
MSEKTEDTPPSNTDDTEEEVIKEEVELHFYIYITLFLFIFYTSWILPGIVFFYYLLQIFLPNVLEIHNFVSLFLELKPLISLLAMPLVLIGCYLIRMFFLALTTRILWKITEKISPSKEGVIPRNVRSKTAKYYHIRSFIIKYGKNSFTKGAFGAWLSNWFFNFIGSSKIGKGTTLEESVVNDKFLEIGKNCYIGVNSALATHLVEGIFGNISYFKVKVGDNVTGAAMNLIGPGTEINDNSYLLPIASAAKHSVVKGNGYYFSHGALPLRKIFKKRIKRYLKIDPETLELVEDVNGSIENQSLESQNQNDDTEKKDLSLNFVTSSAISRVNIKFLAVYLPILFLSGFVIATFWHWYLVDESWVWILVYLPFAIFGSIYIFILACLLFSKLFLILINLIHKPKEGIFKAEIGDTDFEFWKARTEIKKIALWFMRNSPLPWVDALAFRLFGMDMDFSSHLNDAWCDSEFIKFGRRVLVGQGASINSSMVVGKYLIIKKVILDDYVLIGGMATIAPGTIVGRDTVVGAISNTVYNQVLESGWVYFGMPVIKLKPNKYAESRRDLIIKRDVDTSKKFEMEHEVNIDEDKRELIKPKRLSKLIKKIKEK